MRLYRWLAVLGREDPRLDPLDVLILILGNIITGGWFYLISRQGAIFPDLSRTVQMVALSLFEFLTLLTAVDLLFLLRSRHVLGFVVRSVMLWLPPVLFTLQIMQRSPLPWLPVNLYIGLQLLALILYALCKWRPALGWRRVLRMGGLVGVFGVLVAASVHMGLFQWINQAGERELREAKASARLHFEEGERLMKEGHMLLAEEQLRTAVRYYPGYEEAQASLGMVYTELGRYDRAIEAFRKTLLINPKNVYHRVRLGIAYVRAGQEEKAIREWNKVLEADPNRAEVLELLKTYRRLGGAP